MQCDAATSLTRSQPKLICTKCHIWTAREWNADWDVPVRAHKIINTPPVSVYQKCVCVFFLANSGLTNMDDANAHRSQRDIIRLMNINVFSICLLMMNVVCSTQVCRRILMAQFRIKTHLTKNVVVQRIAIYCALDNCPSFGFWPFMTSWQTIDNSN